MNRFCVSPRWGLRARAASATSAACLLISVNVASADGWASASRIASVPGAVEYTAPLVSVGADGTTAVTWVDEQSAPTSNYPSRRLVRAMLAIVDTDGTSSAPQVLDSGYTKPPGDEDAPASVAQGSPQVAVNSDGEVFVVWGHFAAASQATGLRAARFSRSGTRLSTSVVTARGALPPDGHGYFANRYVALSNADDAYVVWMDWERTNLDQTVPDTYSLHLTRFDGSSRRRDSTLGSTGIGHMPGPASLNLSRNGGAIVGWVSQGSNSFPHLFAFTETGGLGPDLVSGTSISGSMPLMNIADDGTTAIAGRTDAGSLRLFTSAGQLLPPISLGGRQVNILMSLSLSNAGNLCASAYLGGGGHPSGMETLAARSIQDTPVRRVLGVADLGWRATPIGAASSDNGRCVFAATTSNDPITYRDDPSLYRSGLSMAVLDPASTNPIVTRIVDPDAPGSAGTSGISLAYAMKGVPSGVDYYFTRLPSEGTTALTCGVPPLLPCGEQPATGNGQPVGSANSTNPQPSLDDPLCSDPITAPLCVPRNYYPAPGPSRKPCDPGTDSGWVNVTGTTFACIFSGNIWDDPTLLTAKQKCTFGLAIDVLPFAKVVKLPKYVKATGSLRLFFADAAKALRKTSYPGKLTKDAKIVDDLKLGLRVIKTPDQALLTVVSSRRVLDALILKLGSGGPEARRVAQKLAVGKTLISDVVDAVSGAQTINECRIAFAGP